MKKMIKLLSLLVVAGVLSSAVLIAEQEPSKCPTYVEGCEGCEAKEVEAEDKCGCGGEPTEETKTTEESE